MNAKVHQIGSRVFALLGLIPAVYLLVMTIMFLPDFFRAFLSPKQLSDSILLLALLLGVMAFVGLCLQIIFPYNKRIKLKLWFLSLGLLGYVVFMSLFVGWRYWVEILDFIKSPIEEAFGFWILLWPSLVSLVLIGYNIWLLIRLPKEENQNLL